MRIVLTNHIPCNGISLRVLIYSWPTCQRLFPRHRALLRVRYGVEQVAAGRFGAFHTVPDRLFLCVHHLSYLPTIQRWGLSKGLNNLDSQFETAEKWIDEQVTAMENFYSGMSSVPMVKEVENARKTILSGHLYIIRDDATYTIDGKQIRGNVLSQ